MSLQQHSDRNERFLRRYEYEDEWVVAADLGLASEDVDVDIVGRTAIVVAQRGDSVSEAEFELPGSDAAVDMNNGVLTITVSK